MAGELASPSTSLSKYYFDKLGGMKRKRFMPLSAVSEANDAPCDFRDTQPLSRIHGLDRMGIS